MIFRRLLHATLDCMTPSTGKRAQLSCLGSGSATKEEIEWILIMAKMLERSEQRQRASRQ